MTIRQKISPNFNKGRSNYKPDIIVCHISEGYYESGCDWLCNPASGASTHFFVSKKGEVTQLVDLQNTAWGNGTNNTVGDSRNNGSSNLQIVKDRKVSANNYTISIEHEGFYKDNKGQLTKEQLAATIELIMFIRKEVKRIYGIDIPIDRQHIVGHCDIAPKWKPNCPGQNYPFDEIIKQIKNSTTPSTPITNYKISESNLKSLVNFGVISTPTYWTNIELQYLNELCENTIPSLDKRINNGITDFNVALKVLVDAKIISSPNYWVDKVKTVKYLDLLIINMANKSKVILEKIVHAEACGENEKGQILVANVIMNRVKDKGFPNSIYEVVFQDNQFEPIRNDAYIKANPSDKVKAAVSKAINGTDYSQGALYFCTPKAVENSKFFSEAITKGKIKYLFTHGGHRFYK